MPPEKVKKKYYDEMSHKVFLKYRNTYHFEIIENELLEIESKWQQKRSYSDGKR